MDWSLEGLLIIFRNIGAAAMKICTPVFVHKRENHKFLRCELDFVIVRYGIWAVVEVDGEGFHHETPAQAYERLESFQDQGVKIIRVKANIASGPKWAKDVLAKIDERFEYFRNSR